MNSFLFKHAAEILAAILAGGHPADRIVSQHLRKHHLGQRDRGEVAELVYAALRRHYFLEALGATTPRERLLFTLNRVLGHKPAELSALASARELEMLEATRATKADDLPLYARADLPPWLVEELALPEEELLALGRGFHPPAPLDIRVNPFLISREAAAAALEQSGIRALPTPWSPFGLRLDSGVAINRHPLFTEGKIEVQDEGSQLVGLLVSPTPHDMVVDFCAGAGGKTLLLAGMMKSRGRVYAFDVSLARLAKLKPRMARAGLSNVHPAVLGSENDPKVKRLAGKIDRVLVDAPCSGFGTLRRNPDLKLRHGPQALDELTTKQARILASAARMVKPGGRLVYATCSILPKENDEIVSAFLREHEDFQLRPANELLKQKDIALDTGPYLRLYPHIHGCDGFFAAVLDREP